MSLQEAIDLWIFLRPAVVLEVLEIAIIPVTRDFVRLRPISHCCLQRRHLVILVNMARIMMSSARITIIIFEVLQIWASLSITIRTDLLLGPVNHVTSMDLSRIRYIAMIGGIASIILATIE